MNEKLKTAIHDGFLNWSGGFPPDSEEQISVYLDYSAPLDAPPELMRRILRDWAADIIATEENVEGS